MTTHFFDTSALLAHVLDEPGADQVDRLLGDPAVKAGISVLTRFELWTRLCVMLPSQTDAQAVWRRYVEELTKSHPVSERTTELAIGMRKAAAHRLPPVGAIIAATAQELDAVLVHRDPHLRLIPARLLKQDYLPPKPSG